MELQFALMFLSDWSGSTIYSEPPQATQWKDQVLDFEDTFEDRSPFLRWLPEHAQGCLH